ncbi:MAG: YbaN family protein [Bacillota bacterium]|nr:YbaN family protein [Bacillota bacterium]
MKILFIIFGIISFILGAIGVVLPILPTTPFLLLSAFLFSRSSDKFHNYLIQTKLYQKYINEMVIERKTTRKKRNRSLLTVTCVFLIAMIITPVRIGKICLFVVMSIHHYIMLKKVEIINE